MKIFLLKFGLNDDCLTRQYRDWIVFIRIDFHTRHFTYRLRLSPIQVIVLKDIVRPPQANNFNDVYIVYELMDTDLHQIIRSNQPLTDDHCRVSTSIISYNICLLLSAIMKDCLIIVIDHKIRFPVFSVSVVTRTEIRTLSKYFAP